MHREPNDKAAFWCDEEKLSHDLFKIQPILPGLKLCFAFGSTGMKVWQPWRDTGKNGGEYYFSLGYTPDNVELLSPLMGDKEPTFPKFVKFLERYYSEEGWIACEYVLREILEKRVSDALAQISRSKRSLTHATTSRTP